jgi:ribosomal protein L39E
MIRGYYPFRWVTPKINLSNPLKSSLNTLMILWIFLIMLIILLSIKHFYLQKTVRNKTRLMLFMKQRISFFFLIQKSKLNQLKYHQPRREIRQNRQSPKWTITKKDQLSPKSASWCKYYSIFSKQRSITRNFKIWGS